MRGPSGIGKSDLALQLVDRGGRLVADDYVVLSSMEGMLFATAPETIRGMMEVRGVGVLEVPFTSSCKVNLVVNLVEREAVPRLPEPASESIEGVTIPCVTLCAREASATAKIRIALRMTGTHIRMA